MRKLLHASLAVILSAIVGTPVFALFETNEELILSAEYTMVEAVRSAVTFVPGRAVSAGLGKRNGRTVWKVEILDVANRSQVVYIDAQTGEEHRDK